MIAGKEEFKRDFAKKANISIENADYLYDKFFETLHETLYKYDGFRHIGLGTLAIKERAAKKGRNPQTGEDVEIPKRKFLKFSVSRTLRDELKNS